MKTIIHLFVFVLVFSIPVAVSAQGEIAKKSGEELKTEAEQSLSMKNYVRSRNLFLHAFKAFSAEKNYPKAVLCGTKNSVLLRREYLYKEAFAICWDVDRLIMSAEKVENKSYPELSFQVAQERFYLYSQINNSQKASKWLLRMERFAGKTDDVKVKESLEKDKVVHAFSFENSEKGMDSFRPLLNNYKNKKDWKKVHELYAEMTGLAKSLKKQALAATIQQDLLMFTDSLNNAEAREKMNTINLSLEENKKQIQEQEQILEGKNYHIIILYILILILIGIIVVGASAIKFYIHKANAVKLQMKEMQKSNKAKSDMMPRLLEQLAASYSKMLRLLNASSLSPQEKDSIKTELMRLSSLNKDLQTLTEIEKSIAETYEQSEFFVDTFCKEVTDEIKPLLKEGILMQLETPHMIMKANPEILKEILVHLLRNAAEHTIAGKISLTFKKRSAHTVQFYLMDTGCGIAEELQETLFIPLAQTIDLSLDKGLGLPICQAKAQKMNGTLSLDTNYKKGAFFILELRS